MIYLIRHGEDDNTRLGGWSDAHLSRRGIEQALRAGRTIKAGAYDIRHIYSSDLPRARETAEIIAGQLKLPVSLRREFRETNNGDLAGISKERFQREYPGLFWRSLAWEQPYPNGESPVQFHTRIVKAWESFQREVGSLDGNVLLVTHGGVIDAILCAENGVPYTNSQITFHTAFAEIVPVRER